MPSTKGQGMGGTCYGKYVKMGDRLVSVFTWEEITKTEYGERCRSNRLIRLEELNGGPLKEGTVVSRHLFANMHFLNGLDKSMRQMYGYTDPEW